MAVYSAPASFSQLEQGLLALPESHRVQLVETLLDSLPVPDGILEEGTPEFAIEIERRCKEVEDGAVQLIPYETVMHNLRLVLENG